MEMEMDANVRSGGKWSVDGLIARRLDGRVSVAAIARPRQAVVGRNA